MNTVLQQDLWRTFHYETDDCRMWTVGPVRFWVRRSRTEWVVAIEQDKGSYDDLVIGEPCSPPADVDWQRWPVADPYRDLCLSPALPDRPVIVRPENKIHVLPGETVRFFIGIPLWIRLSDRKGQTLCEIPTRILSNSWFGTPVQGEQCYMSLTSARRSATEISSRPFRAISTVEIRNDDHRPLPVDRICLRVPYLSLFQGRQHLWTNDQRIVYLGADHPSKLVLTQSGPELDRADRKVGDARAFLKRGLFAPSLGTFNPLQH